MTATIESIVDLVYPVGSLYFSTDSTNPSDLFGGTWTRIEDTFLLAGGSTYTPGTTGGSTAHFHATSNHTLTTDEIPAHTHGGKTLTGTFYDVLFDSEKPKGRSGICTISNGQRTRSFAGDPADSMRKVTINASHTHNSVGLGKAHNHGNTDSASSLPPYLSVYVWQRTA